MNTTLYDATFTPVNNEPERFTNRAEIRAVIWVNCLFFFVFPFIVGFDSRIYEFTVYCSASRGVQRDANTPMKRCWDEIRAQMKAMTGGA